VYIAVHVHRTFSGLGYNSVTDNTVFSFIWLLLTPKSAKSYDILRKFELMAVQQHARSSILVPIESTYATSYSHGIISYTFRDTDVFSSKIASCFPYPPLFDAP